MSRRCASSLKVPGTAIWEPLRYVALSIAILPSVVRCRGASTPTARKRSFYVTPMSRPNNASPARTSSFLYAAHPTAPVVALR